MTKFGLLNRMGYTSLVNNKKVVQKLEDKGTKTAKEVAEKINRIEYYQIFTNGQDFIINSRFLVTKQEMKQLEKVLGGEIADCDEKVGNMGFWEEWVESGEEGAILIPTEKKEKRTENEYIKTRNVNYVAQRMAEMRR